MSEIPQEIEDQVIAVMQSYAELVRACGTLGDLIGWSEEYILRKVMPKVASERADSTRIVDWFDSEREEIAVCLAKASEDRDRLERRKKLILSLGLNEAQLALLTEEN